MDNTSNSPVTVQKEKPKSFLFLGNIIQPGFACPTEISNGYVLTKPDSNQLKYINKNLDSAFVLIDGYAKTFFESEKEELPGNSFRQKPLPESEWKYRIIEHDHHKVDKKFLIALSLADVSLDVLLEMEAHHLDPAPLNNYVDDYSINCDPLFELLFSSQNLLSMINKQYVSPDVNQIASIYNLLGSFESRKMEFGFIEKALEDYSDLKYIPDHLPLKTVGIYSILEWLLTHQSKSREDFISRQLIGKIMLLNNRVQSRLDIKSTFQVMDNTTEEKILELLYKYRSVIAHGSPADFVNELQVLKDKETVDRFLNLLVKRIIVHSLREPELIRDLKEC